MNTTTAKKPISQSFKAEKGFELEIGGIQFELRPDTPFSADVYVDGFQMPEMFTLNYSARVSKLHPNGSPSDAQKEQYLRTVANYLVIHPESLQ